MEGRSKYPKKLRGFEGALNFKETTREKIWEGIKNCCWDRVNLKE